VPAELYLQELCGHEELAIEGVHTAAVVALLNRLLRRQGGMASSPNLPVDAAQLSACDRDSVLAALYRLHWGDRIVSSLTCQACDALFDLSFHLSGLQKKLWSDVEEDTTIALPTAEDEMRMGRYLGTWAERANGLVKISDPEANIVDEEYVNALSLRLERYAPIMDVDLQTTCPECGHQQKVRFDLQSFAMQRWLNDRDQLLQDVHSLASQYRWSLNEILDLPTSMRRRLVERVSG
jgi:hypothetical protein